jgi:hypothetical protein
VNTHEAVKKGLIRTYGDLIRVAKPTSLRGTCCACHDWHNPTWQLSTRASICKACCERKADQVLGSIVTAERRARSWVEKHPDTGAKFISSLSGCSVEFVEGLIRELRP